MIKSIHGSEYVHVSGSPQDMPYINMNTPSAGLVRYKEYTFEVYDGYNWKTATASAPTIDLSSHVKEILTWAERKMKQELELQQLAKYHPAIELAYQNFLKAEQHLNTTIILSKNEQTAD